MNESTIMCSIQQTAVLIENFLNMSYLLHKQSQKTEVGTKHLIYKKDIVQSDTFGHYCYTNDNIGS